LIPKIDNWRGDIQVQADFHGFRLNCGSDGEGLDDGAHILGVDLDFLHAPHV
jgi:hypothetical protein